MAITRQQALDCFASDDLLGIGMEADAVRRSLHPENVVSYTIDRRISLPAVAATLDDDIRNALDCGATAIELHVSGDSRRNMAWLVDLFTGLKQRFPSLWLHCLSATEILALNAGLPLDDTLSRLRDAGLDSIAGDDAGILDDEVRSGPICNAEDWLNVHRSAHKLGIGSIATMTFGGGETTHQQINHLETLRALQAETGGFTAFIPLPFHPAGPSQSSNGYEGVTSVEYLKTLAISRMVLDNIPNLQSSWQTQGLKVMQMGLRFGANDVGSIASESDPVSASSGATEENLRRIIRDAGFKPVQRDTLYRTMFLN